jgi:GDP-4-dehydro-6-deoxy-D-mannose reductase
MTGLASCLNARPQAAKNDGVLSMRILVTGITGFAGGALAETLLTHADVQLFGLSRGAAWPALWSHLAERVPLHQADTQDPQSIAKVLRLVQPEQVYHLAGYAQVGRSFQEPDAAWAGNLTVTRALYDGVTYWGGKPRVLFVGSGLIYGDTSCVDEVQTESTLLRPNSPYAVSKAAADLASYQYTRHPGHDIVRARPFNHIGRGQSPEFAIANFARQIIAIERGRQAPVLETGNLSPRRDLTDVRDMVHAYALLMDKGRTGEAYNIASGKLQTMQSVLERLLALAGLKVDVRPRSTLVRTTELVGVRVDTAKLHQATGWTPRYSLDETLRDTLAFWRRQP